MADDGAGPAVVAVLREAGFPTGVRVEDGASDSLRLVSLWNGEPHVWLIDALIRDQPPGTVHRLAHAEILSIPQRHGTVHQLSLPESLRWLAVAEPAMATITYRLWGIEPAFVEPRPGLSAPVAAAVQAVAAEIMRVATAQSC